MVTSASSSNSPPGKPKGLPASLHLISGAISGTFSVLAFQPLDLIKTRVQQDASTSSRIAEAVGLKSKRPGVLQTARDVVRTDGVKGLWRGTTPTLIRNVPGISMYFLTLSEMRAFMGRHSFFVARSQAGTTSKVRLTTAGDLIVGSTARTAVGFVLMPITVVKTLSESTLVAGRPASLTHTFSQLYSTGGLRSLWVGSLPTALRDAPSAGLFIVFYERGLRFLQRLGFDLTSATSGGLGAAIGGGVASLGATLLTTPFDVLKTRRQVAPLVWTSMASAARGVWQERGLAGFWSGAALRIGRKVGSSAVGWGTYEGLVARGARKGERKGSG